MSPSRHERTPLASERIDRVLFACLGAGGLIFVALAADTAVPQSAHVHPAEGLPLLVLLSLLCAVLAVLPAFASPRLLRTAATVYVIVYTAALAAWLPLQRSPTLPDHTSPWILTIITVATSCAAFAWTAHEAWTYIIVVCLAGGLVRYFSDTTAPILAVQEFAYMLLICTIFAALIQVIRNAGSRQDAATRAAYADAAGAAEARARTEQRARFGALVHDDVISTLLVASHGDASMRETMREYARRALARIAAMRAPDAVGEEVPPSESAARLRAASDIPGAPQLSVGIATTVPIPATVVEALSEALGEALRNSIRHAGGPGMAVHRRADAVIDEEGIRIEVSDDGLGFWPQRVPPERLGVRVSVIGRMTAVPGGSATVTSRPNDGTTVTLQWRRAQWRRVRSHAHVR